MYLCWVALIFTDSHLVFLIFYNIVLMVREGGHEWEIWSVRRREAKIIDFYCFWIGFHYASRQRSEIGHMRREDAEDVGERKSSIFIVLELILHLFLLAYLCFPLNVH